MMQELGVQIPLDIIFFDKKTPQQRKRKATLASKKAAKRFKRQFWSAVFQELLPIVPPMGKTPGIAGTAEWAVVCDICVACLKPPKGCMCM